MPNRSYKSCKKSNIFLPTAALLLLAVIILLPSLAAARIAPEAEPADRLSASKGTPNAQFGVHFIGQVAMTITNLGVFGTGFVNISDTACAGGPCPSCEYPWGSGIDYLFGGSYWIGAVVGNDTLVSVGGDGWIGVYEMYPGEAPNDSIIIRSNEAGHPYESPDAVSNLDYVATFNDTLDDPAYTAVDPTDNRNHIPLNIRFTQNSYSWKNGEIDDFILYECWVENFGDVPLSEVWIGIYVDGDVYHPVNELTGYGDDLTGFLPSENMAYIMDNDGDPMVGGIWNLASARAAMGVKFHGSEPEQSRLNLNWWISNDVSAYDFGPRLAHTPEDPFRFFGDHLGTPNGDRNKYYILRHAETDYDQMFTSISHAGDGFLPPPDNQSFAEDISDGNDTRVLLSFGPFNLNPGDSVHFFYSIVMGNNVHVEAADFQTYFDPQNPQAYYDRLNFTELIANADKADSIYRDIAGLPTAADDDYGLDSRPNTFLLSGNYPNPFNPATTIEYTLPRRTYVSLRIFNLLGQNIRTLVNTDQDTGTHTVRWDGRDQFGRAVSSGIYFYQLKTDERVETKKMMLLK